VLPAEGGDLLDYMNSLERLLAERRPRSTRARPGDPRRRAKIREYIDHRNQREQEILAALRAELT
jgi:hypothetical protein